MEDSGRENNAELYGCPSCITREAWNAYINAPFDATARRAFMQTITFLCIDKTKKTDMTPPYGITYKSVTTDLGTVATKNGPRKVDARLYNAYFLFLELYSTCHQRQKALESMNSAEARLK